MPFTTELHMLVLASLATALMWVPYTLARIVTRGLAASLGNPGPAGASPSEAPWAQRAKSAHANAVENLAVFAPLVLVAAVMGVSTPATVLAAKIYLGARLVHWVVYTAGIPAVRTLAFLTGFGACITLVLAILGGLA